MINKHISLEDLFTDIADAIREKTGITEIIPAVEFPPTNSIAIDLPQVKIISNYNRHDDYIAEISYPDY